MTNQREIALKIICKTIQDESYSNLLMRQELNAEWVFAGIYADEGISATSCKHRENF